MCDEMRFGFTQSFYTMVVAAIVHFFLLPESPGGGIRHDRLAQGVRRYIRQIGREPWGHMRGEAFLRYPDLFYSREMLHLQRSARTFPGRVV